jgi:hypothetical protein
MADIYRKRGFEGRISLNAPVEVATILDRPARAERPSFTPWGHFYR